MKTKKLLLSVAVIITISVLLIGGTHGVKASSDSLRLRTSQYKAMEGSSVSDLEEKVNGAIRDGWQPVGGISVYEAKYVQAVAK